MDRKLTAFLIIAVLCSVPHGADASTIKEAISDLYGGDGITLQAAPVFNHSAHFTSDSLNRLNEISLRALDLEGLTFSSDVGGGFVFDPVVDDFVAEAGALGSMVAESPTSLESGEMRFGLKYSDVEYSRADGQSLDDFHVSLSHVELAGPGPDVCIGGPPDACYQLELDEVHIDLDVELSRESLALFFDYGVNDRLDIGITLPVVRTSIDVTAQAEVHAHESAVYIGGSVHSFDPLALDGDGAASRVSRTKTGIGDVMLRSKYTLFDGSWRAAAIAHLRVPIGEEDNLQGNGLWGGITGFLVQRTFDTPKGRLSPHLNLLVDFNSNSVGAEEIHLVAGANFGFKWFDRDMALSLDYISRRDLNHRDGSGDSIADLAFGAKVRMGENHSIGLSWRKPLDRNDGLRADNIVEMAAQFAL